MKLQRAEDLFGQLVAEHERFTDPATRNPYRMLAEYDAKPGYILWRAKIVEVPPLEKWGSHVGECVHALRSALITQLIPSCGSTSRRATTPSSRSVSPATDGVKTESGSSRAFPHARWQKCNGCSRNKRGRDARFHPLALIHEIDIIDKHRRPNLVGPLVRAVRLIPSDCVIEDDEVLAGPFVDGTPISRYKAKATGPNPHVQAVFAFDITFGDGEPLQGEPVIERLHDLRLRAGEAVSRFDKYFL